MMDLWTRIQVIKLNYQMGAINKEQYIAHLGWLHYEAAHR